jgi:hypothetical protein
MEIEHLTWKIIKYLNLKYKVRKNNINLNNINKIQNLKKFNKKNFKIKFQLNLIKIFLLNK